MKQKNLVLLVVAVGCGLLAAFLTTQMTGKTATVEQAEILVAAKELPVGTKFEKDKFAELVKKKKVSRADVPANAAISEDELLGKSLTRGLRPDDFLAVTDVAVQKLMVPPAGKHLYTIKLPYENVGPWVMPGREVDVVCTHRAPGTSVVRHIKLLPELLVMAVDTEDKISPTTGGRTIVNTVTLAGNLDESRWLQLAQDAGAQLRFLVRSENSEKFTKLPDEELEALFNNDLAKLSEAKEKPQPKPTDEPAPSVITVKYPVVMKDVKAGQVIDDEFITKCMQTQPFVGPAPADVIMDLTPHKGKVLIQDVASGRYLTENVLGAKPEVKPVETPKVAEKKPVEVWDQRFITGSGTKTYRFERFDKKGEWQFKGEVQEDGSVTPVPMPGLQPKPDAKGGTGESDGKVS
ncbi:MAG: hypothetical protein U0798_12415 [Gemmataceae bacterium]